MPRLRRWLIALSLFVLPLLICPWNTGYSYTKSAFALAMISLLLLLSLGKLWKGEGPLYLTELFYPGLALIAVALLSLINATSPGIGLQSLVLLVYSLLFYLLLANAVRSESDIHLYLGSILAAALLAALYGILQYHGILPGAPRAAKGTGAIISTLGNRNFLGGFLVYLAFPSLILIFRLRNIVLRGLSLLILVTIIYTLTLIGSDGAWLALAASGAFFIGGLLYFKLYRAFKLKGLIIGTALLILWMGLLPTAPSLLSGSSIISDGSSRSASSLGLPPIDELVRFWQRNSGRVRAWDWWIGWEMLKDHPLLGVGLGHYKVQFLPYKAQFLQTERGKHYNFYILRAGQAHNEYVQTAAEMGLLGILVGGFLIFTIFFSAFKGMGRARSPQDRFIMLALLSGVVALLTHALVSFPLHLPASALDFILLLGLLNSRYFHEHGPELKLGRQGRWAILAFILALVISVSILGVRDLLADIHLQRGKQMLALGADQQAETELRESIALDFQPQSNLFYLGALYAKEGRYRESLTLFRRSLNCYIIETTYWYLGTLSLKLRYYDDALKYLVLLARISPSPKLKKRLPEPLGRLEGHAVALLKAGRGEKALRWFDELATVKLLEREKRLEANYFRAMIRINRGQVVEGIAILQQLIAEEPGFWRAYIGLGGAYRRLKKQAEAQKYYAQALKAIEAQLAQDRAKLKRTTDEGKQARLGAEIKLLEEWQGKLKKMLEG